MDKVNQRRYATRYYIGRFAFAHLNDRSTQASATTEDKMKQETNNKNRRYVDPNERKWTDCQSRE